MPPQTSSSLRYSFFLRHVILKGISSQMSSASERIGAGLPTAMAAAELIAVGTTHGFILVFDSAQVLKCSLGGKAFGADYGAVSALSFNADCSRLLAGFAKGSVIEFDIVHGKHLQVKKLKRKAGKMNSTQGKMQTLVDAHPLGSAVTLVRFTDDPALALVADSGGSVFEVIFRKTLGIRGYSSRSAPSKTLPCPPFNPYFLSS